MYRKCIAVIATAVVLGVPSTALAGPTLNVDPNHVKFGKQPFHSFTKRAFTVTNVSSQPVKVSIEPGFVPDDFSPGQPESTCPLLADTELAPRQSCTHVIGYYADPAEPFLGPRRIEIKVVASSLSGRTLESRNVVVTARAVSPISIDPDRVQFGKQPFETLETRSFTVTNRADEPLVVTIEPQLPDDFSHLIDSTCILGDTELEPGESCTTVVGFRPTLFFAGLETASVRVTARDLVGALRFEGIVEIAGQGV
jgi:phage terminase large subunit-like protein